MNTSTKTRHVFRSRTAAVTVAILTLMLVTVASLWAPSTGMTIGLPIWKLANICKLTASLL